MSENRLQQLTDWLNSQLHQTWQLSPLAGDASFRRYFRLKTADKTFVVMDAPPDKENCQPFIAISQAFAKAGVHVPTVIASDLTQGFLLLSDLGDDLYLNLLNEKNADSLYLAAIESLFRIQSCQKIDNWQLPHFDQTLFSYELHLFSDWFLTKHLNLTFDIESQKQLNRLYECLIESAISQPQICVHRDYHSRNLLHTENSVGVLDFQDAVWGPLTYDAVSLFRDCYITWPDVRLHNWIEHCYLENRSQHQLKHISKDQYWQWFDWQGLQRHLKVIGIFCRLNHRDGKSQYLNDLPRIFNYVITVCDRYSELKTFKALMENSIIPLFNSSKILDFQK